MFVAVMAFARKLDWIRRIGLSCLIPYLFLVFSVTVFLRSPSETANINLEPFYSYKQYYLDEFTWFEIRANALLFIPIGILLPMVVRKPGLPLLIGVCISVTIELLQFLLHRGLCETDDVISNSIGLFTGYCIFLIIKAVVFVIKKLVKYFQTRHNKAH